MAHYIKNRTLYLFVAIVLTLTFSACEKDDPKDLLPNETVIVNEFIYNTVSDYYLWDDFIPQDIEIYSYPDPYDLFDVMKYEQLDHWSAATDDYLVFQNSLNGIQKMGGYKLALLQLAGSQTLYGVVEMVYSGSSADLNGLKRGDIIAQINGQNITSENYAELFGADTYTISLGQKLDGQITETGETVNIIKTELTINPILFYDVIEVEGIKIGYFVYDQFLDSYSTELNSVFQYFKNQNIDEFVLDLRYNPGGYLNNCAELASMIVPSVSLDKTFLSMQWNKGLTEYLILQYGENSEYFVLPFPTPVENINMPRMIVLTSERSASASEAIINGLKPYMDITIIGGKTVGKYTGASLFYDVEHHKHDWGIYLVINRISNSLGITDYTDGFMPDFEVADDYTTPLGDVSEPLLAKAIEQLTGVTAKKTETIDENIKLFTKYYEHRFEKNGLMITPSPLKGN